MKWSPKLPRSRCRRSRAIRTTGPSAGSTPGRHSPPPGRAGTPADRGEQAAGVSGTSAMESITTRLSRAAAPSSRNPHSQADQRVDHAGGRDHPGTGDGQQD